MIPWHYERKKGVVHMDLSIGSYVRRGKRLVRRWTASPRLRMALRAAGGVLGGLVLSAASLGHRPVPLLLGALSAGLGPMPSMMMALGGGLGYRLFWGARGTIGLVWILGGLVIGLSLGRRRLTRTTPYLAPSLAALAAAASGLLFRAWGLDEPALGIYLLQIFLALLSSRVTALVLERRDPVADWLAAALVVLALAQIGPTAALDLGLIAAGALGAAAPFPAAALAGAALDLAQIVSVPMTGVMALAFLVRLWPRLPRWTARLAPAAMYLVVAPLCGTWDLGPAVALGLGGGLSLLLPPQSPMAHRRGETGLAQVRLELSAQVMMQTEELLLEVTDHPIDEGALIAKAAGRACTACPCRKGCRDAEAARTMPPVVLHRPLIDTQDLPIRCRKPGRLLLEVRRSQDQYRSIRADRDRQREYRQALIQQYRFLAEYLQDLADSLPRRGETLQPRFDVEVALRCSALDTSSGDRCAWFAGTLCRYYVLLCDGMGTGEGAAREGRTAIAMLRRLLSAGYPAEHALESLNSLCALRERAGAVTVDLAQIDLQSGRTALYKWGAAPSLLLTKGGPETIGTPVPPPGVSLADRETVDRLSLRRGEVLLLLSDGVDTEAALSRGWELGDQDLEDLTAKVLRFGRGAATDDATALAVRLKALA